MESPYVDCYNCQGTYVFVFHRYSLRDKLAVQTLTGCNKIVQLIIKVLAILSPIGVR